MKDHYDKMGILFISTAGIDILINVKISWKSLGKGEGFKIMSTLDMVEE